MSLTEVIENPNFKKTVNTETGISSCHLTIKNVSIRNQQDETVSLTIQNGDEMILFSLYPDQCKHLAARLNYCAKTLEETKVKEGHHESDSR